MTEQFSISRMSLDDLRLAADWAAAEGWNPGLEDAEAFHNVDPDGFLMGWLGDEPVTAISVVRHSDEFGFLGFYLCHPNHRGKGYGMVTWQAGMAHLADRVVGLDGVPAQQANYERSGFRLMHHTQRYAGSISGKPHSGLRLAEDADEDAMLAMDRRVNGTDRRTYLSNWLRQTETRQTLVSGIGADLQAVATIRACREGHKIGPVYCAQPELARPMIEALVHAAGAESVMIDIPDPNAAGVALAHDLGLRSIFSCARMYKGTALDRKTAQIFGEVSFELG